MKAKFVNESLEINEDYYDEEFGYARGEKCDYEAFKDAVLTVMRSEGHRNAHELVKKFEDVIDRGWNMTWPPIKTVKEIEKRLRY